MPLYEYLCSDCERTVTVRRPLSETSCPECPICGGTSLSRVISQFSILTSRRDRLKDLSWVDQALANRLRTNGSTRPGPALEETLDLLESD